MGRGRPLGSLNKATILARQLFAGDTEAIIQKCVDQAKEGDSTCLKLAMDRICPPRVGAPIDWPMPPFDCKANYVAACQSVVHAVATGQMTPPEAEQVLDILGRVAEVVNFADQLEWDFPTIRARHKRFREAQNDPELAIELLQEMEERDANEAKDRDSKQTEERLGNKTA